MKILVLLSQKGGSGKTTLAVHLAVAAEEAGEKTVIIDTDPQESATSWANLRKSSTPEVTTVGVSEIKKVLEISKELGKTLVIIDTAPHASPSASTAASFGDFIVMPCRPTAFDLATIQSSVHITKTTKSPAAFVLTACPSRAPEIKESRDVLFSYGFPVSPIEIMERRAYARAVANGSSVTEFDKKGKAAVEITQLWNWIKEQL